MFFLVAGTLITVYVILATVNSSRKRKKKIIDQIRNNWGKPKAGTFTFEAIEKYAAQSGGNGFHRLSTQTLNDIDFLDLFSFVDRTTSKVGQQFLFNQLLHPTNDAKTLNLFNRQVEMFAKDQPLREEVQKELLRLSGSDAYFVCSLLKKKLLERPLWLPLLYVNAMAVAIMGILAFSYPIALIYMLIPITINMFMHYWNKSNMFLFLRSFPQLSLLIDVSDKLREKELSRDPDAILKSIDSLKEIQWKIGFLSLNADNTIKDELSQLGTYFIELLKAFFVVEVMVLFELTKTLESKHDSIVTLFDFVGEIDSAISVASLRAGEQKTCVPKFAPPMKEMVLRKVYHPLIKQCVKNDLHVSGKSVLITGSNMSGKTTFLRTVVINSIMAQTICTCFADEFESPMLRQYSSIRIDDNILEGKSYYYEEVNTMGAFVKEVHSSFQNLFLLDEVFKGTNTVERIAAAKAALSYLNRGANIIIVSTHDFELPGMLQQEYDQYHFSESIKNDQLHFDHKIKPGPLLAGNAIKILEMSNYPTELVNEARELSISLSSP
jgi:DNA mismatch repair ATPase MutS